MLLYILFKWILSSLLCMCIVRYYLPSLKYGFFYLRIAARHIASVHSFEVY